MSNSSNLHQEFKEDYEVLPKEADLFHILFVDKHVKGKTIHETCTIQKYNSVEWYHVGPPPIKKETGMRANIEKLGIKVTGHDEYSVLHDPGEAVKKAAEAEKQKAEEAAKKKEDAKVKAAEEKKAKADKIAAEKKAAEEK